MHGHQTGCGAHIPRHRILSQAIDSRYNDQHIVLLCSGPSGNVLSAGHARNIGSDSICDALRSTVAVTCPGFVCQWCRVSQSWIGFAGMESKCFCVRFSVWIWKRCWMQSIWRRTPSKCSEVWRRLIKLMPIRTNALFLFAQFYFQQSDAGNWAILSNTRYSPDVHWILSVDTTSIGRPESRIPCAQFSCFESIHKFSIWSPFNRVQMTHEAFPNWR